MTVAPTPHRAAHQCHHIAMIGDVTVRELVRRSRVVNRTVKDMQSIATAGERQPFSFDHARIPYFLTAPARDWTFLMLHDRLAWGVRVGMLICPMCFAPTATHRSYHVVHECPIALDLRRLFREHVCRVVAKLRWRGAAPAVIAPAFSSAWDWQLVPTSPLLSGLDAAGAFAMFRLCVIAAVSAKRALWRLVHMWRHQQTQAWPTAPTAYPSARRDFIDHIVYLHGCYARLGLPKGVTTSTWRLSLVSLASFAGSTWPD